MSVWRWMLLLVAAAALAAFGWHWVAVDPGYVLVRLHGWRVQTTVVAAVVILVLGWVVLVGAWRLLRWPFGAFSRRQRRLSRRRLSEGLVALLEGRHGDAERDLNRAARLEAQRGVALLASAESASRRGEQGRALEILAEAAQAAPQASRVLRARVLRRDGKAAEALALLAPEADKASLPPGGWRELALSALAAGDSRRALAALEPLQKSGALGARGYAMLEAKVLVAAIHAAPDGAELNTLWSRLPKAQRRVPAAVDAYARCIAGFGLVLPAMDELESALRREWSSELAATYGVLAGGDLDARLRRTDGWLDQHPNDPALLLAAARIAVRAGLWGKARANLDRALALAPSADVWEVLGDLHAGQQHADEAQRCYRNALALARGETVREIPAGQSGVIDTRVIAVEERDEHGVPRLRG